MENKFFQNKYLQHLGVFIALFFLALAVYYPNIKGTFILDDYVWIEPLNLKQIEHLFVDSWEHGNTLRPIMRLQFFSSRLLFGENPLGWHLTNIFLHALVAWCLYFIARRAFKNSRLAIVCAAIFTVFPTNHETVAWISGRTHPFGFLLSLASWHLLYLGFSSGKRRVLKIVLGYVILLAAFLTYEVSFAMPLALLAAVIIVGPKTKSSYLVALGSFGLLGALIGYRFLVLGGSIGSVGRQHDNIFLAPFLNFAQFKTLYWYSTEIKITLLALCLVFVYLLLKKQAWKNIDQNLRLVILFVALAVLAYGPFVITHGVAPRFLYSSLFFCALGLAGLWSCTKNNLSKTTRAAVYFLTALIFVFAVMRTYEVAMRYKEVSDEYTRIVETVKRDFPVWPEGKDMLFYKIPNGDKNILAFLTYFNKAMSYGYHGQTKGKAYRAEELKSEDLEKILKNEPIVYEFMGFGKGVKRVD